VAWLVQQLITESEWDSLSIYLSYLPIYLSTYLPIYLPTYLSTYLPIYLCSVKGTEVSELAILKKTEHAPTCRSSNFHQAKARLAHLWECPFPF